MLIVEGLDFFRIHIINVNTCAEFVSCVFKSLCNTDISVLKMSVFSHQSHVHILFESVDGVHHIGPKLDVVLAAFQLQLLDND